MEAATALLHSNGVPFSFTFHRNCNPSSLGHFNKQVVFHRRQSLEHHCCRSRSRLSSLSPIKGRINVLNPIRCAVSSNSIPESENSFLKTIKNISKSENSFLKIIKNVSIDWVNTRLAQLTPIDVVKISAVLSIAIAAAKGTANLLLNPFFWTYFSWTWLVWPWYVAVAVAICGLYCLSKYLKGEANTFEQLAVATSAFTWLTLVPPAYFNGYLQGWPIVFFFAYHYFVFFNISVRKRLYGDLNARPHDPKWDIDTPKWQKLLFCVGIMVGHVLAAFEGTELHRIPAGLFSVAVWVFIVTALLMQYNSTLYLAKYSKNVVEPTVVVQFGPYRWVRHPIYASAMLMFATYAAALRAPFSLCFIVAVCCLYYGCKAKLEENVLIETFGEKYTEYSSKVKYRLIPLVY